MLFRKPISEKTVAENLRKWKAGGLRRLSADKPLPEVVPSGRTPKREEAISDHPCLKPQHFMRILVRALLPLGEGEVLDPFMGSVQLSPLPRLSATRSVGIEIDNDYFRLAETAIPKLASLYPTSEGNELQLDSSAYPQEVAVEDQLAMVLAESRARYRVRKR